MKLFWKIFFSFTALITVVFSIFGMWLVSETFRNSLEKEIEEGDRENQMYQLAFEVNLNTLSNNYRTEKIVKELAESVTGNLDNTEYIYKLYSDEKEVLFETSELTMGRTMLDQMGDADCAYMITQFGNERYLTFIYKSVGVGHFYYLESSKNITELYEERENSYNQYRVVMMALLGMTGIIVFGVSRMLTRSVASLSVTTRQFAKGDYEVRAEEDTDDEIGRLAHDFNVMADNLNQKMDELMETARKQEDFTASFAHELKTPLTSIIGYADMLRTMEMDKEETAQASNYIYSQGKRLENLSHKLLELIVTDKQDYVFRKINCKDLEEEVLTVVTPGLEKKGIVCHSQVEEGTIYGEKDLIISMVVNLIDNARKALSLDGHIWLKGRKVEGGYELMVMDNGCGMPREEIEKITEAFYMVDKSRSRKEGGAGLGMSLCSKIVALHRAKWWIKSKEKEGTAIWVVFPDKEAADDVESEE